jgi:predicted ATPase
MIPPGSTHFGRLDRQCTYRGTYQFWRRPNAELGQFDEARRCIGEAVTAVATTKEKWCEADIQRTAGEIALISSVRDAAKAEAQFERALAIAREQQAKSWELRAASAIPALQFAAVLQRNTTGTYAGVARFLATK